MTILYIVLPISNAFIWIICSMLAVLCKLDGIGHRWCLVRIHWNIPPILDRSLRYTPRWTARTGLRMPRMLIKSWRSITGVSLWDFSNRNTRRSMKVYSRTIFRGGGLSGLSIWTARLKSHWLPRLSYLICLRYLHLRLLLGSYLHRFHHRQWLKQCHPICPSQT